MSRAKLALLARRLPRWWSAAQLAAVNLVFPPQCTLCLAEFDLAAGEPLLCAPCRRKLDPAIVRCPACAMPAPAILPADGRCGACRQSPPVFSAARVLGTYRAELREAVLKMKHAAYEPLAMALGELLARQIEQMPLPDQPHLVVPVPMHWWRRVWRGTSPVQILAETVSLRLGIPLAGRLVRCCRLTERQSSLPASERARNVRGAYRVPRRWNLEDKTILVIDDVITTAATCDEVARVLKRAGAARVFAAAVARAAT